MKKLLLGLFVISALSYGASKEINLIKSAQKKEIINVPRREQEMYKIYVTPLHQTILTFGDEEVLYSELGDNVSFFSIDDTNSVRVKPTDAGLETDLVIKTSEDLYYFKVKSLENSYNPMINFLYPQKENLKRQHHNKTHEKLAVANVKELNFKYKISRKKSWTPTQIFDDGTKTFFYMPKRIQEVPMFLIKDDDGTLSTVTFRIDETEDGTKFYIIDRLFERGILKLGKNKVLIINKNYKFK